MAELVIILLVDYLSAYFTCFTHSTHFDIRLYIAADSRHFHLRRDEPAAA